MGVSRNDVGVLLVRSAVGAIFVYHGSQKLFGAFGGPGIEGVSQFFGAVGIPFPVLNAWLAASAETFGGLALIAGLLSRPAAALLAFVMAVAISVVRSNGFDVSAGGIEYPLLLGLVLVGLAFTGAGRLSVDAVLRPSLERAWSRRSDRNKVRVPHAVQA